MYQLLAKILQKFLQDEITSVIDDSTYEIQHPRWILFETEK